MTSYDLITEAVESDTDLQRHDLQEGGTPRDMQLLPSINLVMFIINPSIIQRSGEGGSYSNANKESVSSLS